MVLRREERPDPYIEFSSLEEQGPLDVFLNYTACELWTRCYKRCYLIEVGENLDATTLVGVGRLDQPNVVDAVLDGQALLLSVSPRYVLVSLDKICPLSVLVARNEEKGGRC